ncbi:MAG: tyrosine-type recombinase/integrase [Solirubrobacterales bacterium]
MKKLGPAWTERSRPPAGYFTKKTAKAAVDAILTDLRRGTMPDPGDKSGKSFGDAVAEWLRYVEDEKGRRPSTVRDYRNTAKAALLPEFGDDTPLEAITDERIDAYRTRLLSENTLSRRSIQKHLVLLSGILKRAKALKWIRENPADLVERVNVRRSGEFNVLSVAQVEAVARKADGMYGAAIIVAAYTGLRAGELRALRWRDVDFANATIHVRRNMPTHGEEDAPKSGLIRSTLLMDDAARALDDLSRRELFTGPDDRVFPHETGGMVGENAMRDALYEAMKAAKIYRQGAQFSGRGFTFHDLRHTFGTLAAKVFPLADVQAWMGHRQIQTTMIYVHSVPKHDAAQRFTQAIKDELELASVSRDVSRTAENQEQPSEPTGTEYAPAA